MMLRRMLTVILGMKMHEYDNDDPECKIDADRCWRYHRYRDNPPVCLPLIGATDLGSTRLALRRHAVGAHLTAAYTRADWADAAEDDGDNDNDDDDDDDDGGGDSDDDAGYTM